MDSKNSNKATEDSDTSSERQGETVVRTLSEEDIPDRVKGTNIGPTDLNEDVPHIQIPEHSNGTVEISADYAIGSGDDVLVENRGDATVKISSAIGNYKHVLENKGNASFENALILGNESGYLGRPGSSVTMENSKFDNEIADIVYHRQTDVTVRGTAVRELIRLTEQSYASVNPVDIDIGISGGSLTGDPELYRVAFALLSAENPIGEQDLAQELRHIARETLHVQLYLLHRFNEGSKAVTRIPGAVRRLALLYYLFYVLTL
jgi:hypothetical protein